MFKHIRKKIIKAAIILPLSLMLFGLFHAEAQAQNLKNDISLRLSRAMMGSGDYRALLYQSKYTHHLNKFMALSGNFGFLNSSDTWSDDAFMAHMNSYYMLDATASFAPIIKQKHIFKVGVGGSYAFRTEISPSITSTNSATPDKGIFYLSEDENDYAAGGISKKHSAGWNMGLDYTFLFTRNIGAGIGLQLINYTDGDIIYSIGFHAGYRF